MTDMNAPVETLSENGAWTPASSGARHLAAFTDDLLRSGSVDREVTADYSSLWRWSIDEPDAFWRAFASFSGVDVATPPDVSVVPDAMSGAGWFPGTTVNYAEQVFRGPPRSGNAVLAVDEDGTTVGTSWQELKRQVASVAEFLRRSGVGHGDRVAAVLPNRLEAVVGLLAAASVGAVWSVVAPEFGSEAIVSRLRQLDPVVLLATTGYDYGGVRRDRESVVLEVVGAIPSLREIVWVGPMPTANDARGRRWDEIVSGDAPWQPESVPFDHPLWVLFSSGTTGVPKGIVHGHGGVLLEHLKTWTLHADLDPGDRLFVVGSTSWVVWNTLVSGLLRGATIVLLDGNPAYPTLDRVWQVAAEHRVSVLGLGAGYVHASMHAGLPVADTNDLTALRMVQVTGSPLSTDAYTWLRSELGDLWLASVSGGTDVAGIFLGGAPTEPVRPGRLQPPALGVAAAGWDADGRAVLDEPAELVITVPMPSMPLRFWNDEDGSRFHESYFATYPGVWRHGDLVEFASDGSSVIVGRSDSTLNRNGIRLGPADLYRVVEALPEVREALVVGIEDAGDYYMPMFIDVADGVDDGAAVDAVRAAIRASLSPRYVPDDIVPVRTIPHTRTGKKLEVPVKRVLQGVPVDEVVDSGSVDDAAVLGEIRSEMVRRRPGRLS
ncbi:hypothetical protein ASG69_15170 [Rhodococcus sp. Leaf225]|nr:hypothetical protein ASG69_15170 [Rhodococcus sp. Leaf225]KQU39813.1 hypothetical protein ASH03_20175 [Rhodococcus sp. Leaf258]